MVTIRVDVTQPIVDEDGEVLNHQKVVGNEVVDVVDDDGKAKPFTVRNAMAKAVKMLLPGAERDAGDHPAEIKDDLFRVLCLVATGDHVDLDDDDRKLIVDRSQHINSFIVHGRVVQAIEAGEHIVTGKANGAGKVKSKDLTTA